MLNSIIPVTFLLAQSVKKKQNMFTPVCVCLCLLRLSGGFINSDQNISVLRLQVKPQSKCRSTHFEESSYFLPVNWSCKYFVLHFAQC